jgi:hypothetical protein
MLMTLSPAALAGDGPGNSRNTAVLTRHPDCTLWVPANPLTARGLATPYQLRSAGQTCDENNQDLAAFVQATIIDPATGNVTVYNPVVKNAGQALQGTAPPVPSLPAGAVVAIWTGFNGNVLRLVGPGRKGFVQFAQQSYDNSPRFFRALRSSVSAGTTTVPGLGTSPVDKMPCPSSRDFSIVDQDQSDNNPQTYPAYGVSNGSDEKTLNYVDKALGCSTWQVPSLSQPGTTSPSGPLQEEQASVSQQAPVALVPGLDPFVLRKGQLDLSLQNLYRKQVGQPVTDNNNDTKAYCLNLATAGEARLKADEPIEAAVPPNLPIGTNLANVLAARYLATWQNLTCQALTGMPSPIQVTTDANGVSISATYG